MSSAIVYNDSAVRVEEDTLPIFSLPPEILEVIFIYGARNYYERHGGFAMCLPTWVNVSYVCRHWRNIALNCSTLWTYHFILSPRWTEELLLRSKQASLKISCIRPYPQVSWWSGVLDNLLRHSSRIQELSFNAPLSLLPEKLSLRAPRLETLEITLCDGPEVSLAIADADTPALQTLRLTSCLLPWSSFNLSRLKILHICRIYPPLSLNVVEFLVALGSMQDLSVLNLDHVLHSFHDFMSSDGLVGVSHKIDLPRLALLAVNEPLPAVVALLSCVEIPLKAQLGITLHLERDTSAEDYAPFSSFLAQRFSKAEQLSSSGPIFRSLIMTLTNDLAAVTFSSMERDCRRSVDHDQLDCNIPLSVVARTPSDSEDERRRTQLGHIVADICRSLPLTNVQTLCVLPDFPYKPEFWREILGCLGGIRYLMMCYGHMPDLSVLSLTTHKPENWDEKPIHGQDSTLGHILVPALEELELVRMLFAPDGGTAHYNYSTMSQKSLMDALSTRKGLRDRVTMIESRVLY